MDVRAAAKILHDWAFTEGLMPDSATTISCTAADYAAITPVEDKGKQLLRTKLVQAIGFDDSAGELIVYTRRAAPASKKALASLPQRVADKEIRYRQGVPGTIGTEPVQPFGSPPYTVRTAGGAGRYTCGSSISAGNCRDAGTLGCLVKDVTGALYGLSNNHISGSCSFADAGLPVLAPGVADVAPGNLNPFTIGLHHQSLPMVAGAVTIIDHMANRDAAIFRIRDPASVSSYQGAAYDTPTEVGDLSAGIAVEKVGRTTGHTRGKVHSEIFGAFRVSYNVAHHGFSGYVFFEPTFAIIGETTLFSDSGDSGSLVTTTLNGNRTAVGIVVAGMNDGSAPGGKVSIVLPLRPVLEGFGVTLVSGHNV